jgi:hypothetical protein
LVGRLDRIEERYPGQGQVNARREAIRGPNLVNRTLEGDPPAGGFVPGRRVIGPIELQRLPPEVIEAGRASIDRLTEAHTQATERQARERQEAEAIREAREQVNAARMAREIEEEEEDGRILQNLTLGDHFPSFSEPFRRELMANEDALFHRILDEADRFVGPRRTQWQHLLVEDEEE